MRPVSYLSGDEGNLTGAEFGICDLQREWWSGRS